MRDEDKTKEQLIKELVHMRKQMAEIKENGLILKKQIGEALEKEEETSRAILKVIPDMMFLVHKDGTYLDFIAEKENELAAPANQLIGKKIYEVVPTELSQQVMHYIKQALLTDDIQIFDYQIQIDSSVQDFEARVVKAKENTVLFIVRNITDRKHLEKKIARLDQLNLIGQMAAGIAHEIRNPMTTVRGFLQILKNKQEDTQNKEYYNLMIDELDRANSIITEFLSLAKDRIVQLELKNLNEVLEVLFPLIQADAMVSNKNVKLELEKIPDFLFDEKEIRQLILNLVRNGLEAMPSGGNLLIRTFLDNKYVVLSIRDQGKGIPQDVLDNIGTPFITTKDNGTGLGLAVSYSIAARHNATIKVETSSSGTTFHIQFKCN